MVIAALTEALIATTQLEMKLLPTMEEVAILEVQRRAHPKVPRGVRPDDIPTDTLCLSGCSGNITVQDSGVRSERVGVVLDRDTLQGWQFAQRSIGRRGMLHRVECTRTDPDASSEL